MVEITLVQQTASFDGSSNGTFLLLSAKEFHFENELELNTLRGKYV